MDPGCSWCRNVKSMHMYVANEHNIGEQKEVVAEEANNKQRSYKKKKVAASG
jgi:pyruvate-formate lyase-activating enzyme